MKPEEAIKWMEAFSRTYNDFPKEATEACKTAIESLKRDIERKPEMKQFFKDMPDEEYLCCPNCGDILTDRIPFENKDFYFHCLTCGQAFSWED